MLKILFFFAYKKKKKQHILDFYCYFQIFPASIMERDKEGGSGEIWTILKPALLKMC
jgi:hypothetical protein